MPHEEAVATQNMPIEGTAQCKIERFAIAQFALLLNCRAGQGAWGYVGADSRCLGLVSLWLFGG